MSESVVIVDCGSGNLRSVHKAFERSAAALDGEFSVSVSNDPSRVDNADRIVLPGVGAFADCRQGLARVAGLDAALADTVITKARPFLGICVGMQLLADAGLEYGRQAGFGWLGGEVRKLAPPAPANGGPRLKVPHMGWNGLELGGGPRHPLFAGIDEGAHVYFVHSFQFRPDDSGAVLATVDYGESLVAAVGRGNLVGTQFHPEKSQAVGLRLIENFLNWQP